MNVDGNYSQDADTTLVVDIASATSYDRLDINGNVSKFAGQVQVNLLNSYTPPVGTEFTIVTAGSSFERDLQMSLGGSFAALSGRAWMIEPGTPNTIVLTVVAPKSPTPGWSWFPDNAPSAPTTVATISGLDSAEMSSVTAVVTWNDGNVTTLANSDLTPNGSAELDAVCSHTYSTNGVVADYAVVTTFYTDGTYSTPIGTVDCTAQVDSPPVTSLAFDADATGYVQQNTSDDSQLATFGYTGNGLLLTGKIDWGDGQTTQGKVYETGENSYGISGDYMHYYAGTATHNVTVTLLAPDGMAYTVQGHITPQASYMDPPPVASTPFDLAADSGLTAGLGEHLALANPYQYPIQLATFDDSLGNTASDYLAWVDWETVGGIDRYTAATVSGAGGATPFSITCTDYDFLTTGVKNATLYLEKAGGGSTSIAVPITIADTLTLTPSTLPIDAMNSGGYFQVAQFTDSDPAAVTSDYTGALTGLPTADVQVVRGADNTFTVYAGLATPYTGSDTLITTTVSRNDAASSATTTATNSIALDGGGYDVFTALPTGGDVQISNGTVLDFGGNAVTLSILTIIDGAVVNGALTADTINLQNAEVETDATAQELIVTRGGYAAMMGNNTLANVSVNGVGSVLQCADGTQISDVALNDGGSINMGNGSTITGTLEVTSVADNGALSYYPCYWIGTGTVEGVVTVNHGGILTVGQNGPATLTAPGGVLITGSGQVVMGDPASAIVGTIDDEGWQSISLVGQVGGSSSALVLGALQQYAPTVTLGTASGDTGTNTYSTIYVVSGTLLINQQSAVSVGATLVIGDPAAFGETAPIVSAPSQGSTQVTGGHGDSTLTGPGGTGTLGDDGPPPVDPAVLAAEAAAQAAAAAHAHAMMILLHQREAVGAAVVNSLAGILNPQAPDAAILGACGMVMQMAMAVRAANDGTVVGASAVLINSTLQEVFAANNMTVTPAADGQGTLGSDATEGFPTDTTDGWLAFNLSILQFLQANTVVLNG